MRCLVTTRRAVTVTLSFFPLNLTAGVLLGLDDDSDIEEENYARA